MISYIKSSLFNLLIEMKRSRSGKPVKPAAQKALQKRITFLRGENKVHTVVPPPKELNDKFWFDQVCVRVAKPVYFQVIAADEQMSVDVNEDGMMRLTAMFAPSRTPQELAAAAAKKLGGLGRGKGGGPRSVLEVCSEDTLFASINGPAPPQEEWITVGSCQLSRSCKLDYTLPPGSYRLRCIGPGPVTIAAEVRDTITKLM